MAHTVVAVAGAVLVRAGVAAAVADQPDLRLLAAAGSIAEADGYLERLRPDVVLVDHEVTDGDGLAYAARLRRTRPEIGVVLLAPSDDQLLFRALDAGISAYLPRSAPIEGVLAALRHAAVAPASFTAPDLAQTIARRRHPVAALSAREAEVLALAAAGLSARRISATLDIGESTVKTYLVRTYEKVGARNRDEALRAAARLGLLPQANPPASGSGQQGVHDA